MTGYVRLLLAYQAVLLSSCWAVQGTGGWNGNPDGKTLDALKRQVNLD